METYNTLLACGPGDDEEDGSLEGSFDRDELVKQWEDDQANGNNDPDPNAPLNPLV